MHRSIANSRKEVISGSVAERPRCLRNRARQHGRRRAPDARRGPPGADRGAVQTLVLFALCPWPSAFALCLSLSLPVRSRSAGGAHTPYTCALTPRPRRTIVQAQGDQTVDQMQQQKQQQQQQQQQKAEIMNSILSPEAQQRRAWASFFFFSPASPLARVTSLHRRPLRRSSATLTLAQLAACACLAQSVASPWSTRPRWIRWR
jgi:hypothetical protein